MVNYAHVFETNEGVVSPEEELSRDNGYVGHITYQCDFADRIQLGIDKLTANGGLGETYPHNVMNNARACSVKFRPAPGQMAGTINGLAEFQHAHVTITYKTPGRNTDQQPETNNLINETLEGHAETQTLDSKNFSWQNDDSTTEMLTSDEAPFKIVRGIDYCVTVHNISNLPMAILNLPGSVNQSALYAPLLGFTFEPETLLFADPVLTRKYDMANGGGVWTPTYRFNIKRNDDGKGNIYGWNAFYRAATGKYEQIYQNMANKGDSPDWQVYKSYPTASLSDVLPFAH
jgi:hypothetical protein